MSSAVSLRLSSSKLQALIAWVSDVEDNKLRNPALTAPQFDYVGPERLRPDATIGIPRYRLQVGTSPKALLTGIGAPAERRDEITLTYIVDRAGYVWVADRHSEHIACARGDAVLAAGEMTVKLSASGIAVIAATNQSTGYCPEPECWSALAQALDAVGIERPDGFEAEFRFGRCLDCRAIAIVKDGDLSCVECGGLLGPVRG